MVTLLCAVIPAAAGVVPSVIAQEDTSLGEQDLAGGIVSDVLDGSDDDDEETNDSDADSENDQAATNTGTVNRNQDQSLDKDNGIAVNEELSVRFAEEPSLRLNQPLDERGSATSASITASGTVIASGGTMTLTSDTNVFSICEDDETGELSNTQNVQSTISSDPVTIEPGRQSFEITTDPITEPIGDGGCEEGQTAILNFVQFIEPVLTIQTKGGNTVTHTFPSVS
jgi:hypothetical protein